MMFIELESVHLLQDVAFGVDDSRHFHTLTAPRGAAPITVAVGREPFAFTVELGPFAFPVERRPATLDPPGPSRVVAAAAAAAAAGILGEKTKILLGVFEGFRVFLLPQLHELVDKRQILVVKPRHIVVKGVRADKTIWRRRKETESIKHGKQVRNS